jgi:hypothetical protein
MSQTFTEKQYLKNTKDSFLAGQQAERNRVIHLLEAWQSSLKPEGEFTNNDSAFIFVTLEGVKLKVEGIIK